MTFPTGIAQLPHSKVRLPPTASPATAAMAYLPATRLEHSSATTPTAPIMSA